MKKAISILIVVLSLLVVGCGIDEDAFIYSPQVRTSNCIYNHLTGITKADHTQVNADLYDSIAKECEKLFFLSF